MHGTWGVTFIVSTLVLLTVGHYFKERPDWVEASYSGPRALPSGRMVGAPLSEHSHVVTSEFELAQILR